VCYYLTGIKQADVGLKQAQLAAWSERVKEVRELYPAYLWAASGTRPLRNERWSWLADSLSNYCLAFGREPTRRITRYLAQVAARARQMKGRELVLETEYTTCVPLAEQLIRLELTYPPVSDPALESEVRAFREDLVPRLAAATLVGLSATDSSSRALYVCGDTDGLARVRATGKNVRVDYRSGLKGVDLSDYDVVVVDGAVTVDDTARIRSHVLRGGGLVMSGAVPFLLAGEDQYLGSIAEWFGATFILHMSGADVTPSADHIMGSKMNACSVLRGEPVWWTKGWAVLPVGLSHRTVVTAWYRDDVAVFGIAVQPDPARPGRVYYQGVTDAGRCPELDSLYVRGIRWAAGLLR
jgi:hypothetical protein